MTKRGTLIILAILFIFLLALLIIFTSKQTMTGFVIAPTNAIRDFFSKLFGAKEVEVKAEGEARILVNLTFDNATHIDSNGGDTGADGAGRSFWMFQDPIDAIKSDLPSPEGGRNARALISTYVTPNPTSPMLWVDRKLNHLTEFYIKFYMLIEEDITDAELDSIKMFYANAGEFYTGNAVIITTSPSYNQYYIYHSEASGTWSPYNAFPGFQQGKWVKYEFYIKYNTIGANDGIVRVWTDGKLSWERTGLKYRSSSDYVVDSFGAVTHFKTAGSDIGMIDGHVRLDGIELWDGMPPSLEKSCADQNGSNCTETQSCEGTWITANDTGKCCIGTCKLNTAPVTTTPIIAPSSPLTDDDLNCSFNVTDSDNDSLTANIIWYKNNKINYTISAMSVINSVISSTILASGNTTGGERWKCSIKPYDGFDYGTEKNSTEVIILDNTPPTITNIQISSLTNYSATITWNTNEPANSTISYGRTLELILTESSTEYRTAHSIKLDNLEKNTTYYYNVTSCDQSGNCATEGTYNFTTLFEFIDTTAPIITLIFPVKYNASEPATEWKSSSTVTFSFNVTDESEVNCNLTINNQSVANKTNVQRGEVGDYFSYSLGNDLYNWSIWCIDSAGNENRSEEWQLYVNYQAPVIDGDRGGDGGGYIPATTPTVCTENWTCDKWSDCIKGKQTRTCWDRNLCNTTINKPATEQTCIEEEGKPLGEGGIVEVIKKPYFKYIIIAAIIVVIAAITVIYLIKSKKKISKIKQKQKKKREKVKIF